MMLGDFSFVKDYNENHDPDDGRFTSGGGSSHKAKGAPSPAATKRLKETEIDIRSAAVEHGVCCDKDGKEIFHAVSDSPTELDLTPDEKKSLKEAYFTHNHKSGKTFSPGDVQVCVENGAKQLRACHPGGAYVLTRQYELRHLTVKRSVFGYKYGQAFDEYRKEAVEKWRASSNKTKEYDLKLRYEIADKCHEWLKKHAEEYGWKYEEEKP